MNSTKKSTQFETLNFSQKYNKYNENIQKNNKFLEKFFVK